MIRDRLVVGISDSKLSEKLQLDNALTLEKAVVQARQTETVKQQQPLLRGGPGSKSTPEAPVGAVNKKPATSKHANPHSPNRKRDPKGTCSRCGKFPPHDRQHCVARDEVCRKCGKRDHFQSICRSSVTVRGVQASHPPSSEENFLGVVTSTNTTNDNPWIVTLQMNSIPVQFHIDTGAEVTVINDTVHKKVGSPSLSQSDQTLRGPSNQSLPVKGKFLAQLQYSGVTTEHNCYVVTDLSRPLLGRLAIEQLKLLARVQAVQEISSPTQKFSKLFTGLGKLPGQYHIKLIDGARPYSLNVPRRVAVPLMPAVKQELKHMEQLGVIARIQEPTEWCSGMVVVPKANGQVRICVDLTKFNQNVCRERYPLPAVEQILAQLSGATVFTKLDANSGFWQMPLSPASAPLTTFITPFGRFCFHRLPFGITSAPEYFQCQMSEMLKDLDGVLCLMDDVLVYGKTVSEHDERLDKVLQTMQKAGMTLNKEKCQFLQKRIMFLGQLIDESGIRPDPGKVAAIKTMTVPSNVAQLRRFLGMINHLSKFAPNLADKTKPLRDLLIKNNQ